MYEALNFLQATDHVQVPAAYQGPPGRHRQVDHSGAGFQARDTKVKPIVWFRAKLYQTHKVMS